MSPPAEIIDSNLKKPTVLETKENEITEQETLQKGNIQNSQFTDDMKSIV